MISVFVRSSIVISPLADFLGVEERHDVPGLGVGQGDGLDDQRAGQLLALPELSLLLVLPGQDAHRGDAQDVALEDLAQLVVPEEDVEGLVPGDFLEVAGDDAPDLGVEDDVQLGEVAEVEDDVPEVGVLEFQGDDLTGVFGLPSAMDLGSIPLLLGCSWSRVTSSSAAATGASVLDRLAVFGRSGRRRGGGSDGLDLGLGAATTVPDGRGPGAAGGGTAFLTGAGTDAPRWRLCSFRKETTIRCFRSEGRSTGARSGRRPSG